MVRMKQFWTARAQNNTFMDSYWVDVCRYVQLLYRMMQVWTVTGQTDAGMYIYLID